MSDDLVSGRVTVDPALVFAINRVVALNEAARRRHLRIRDGITYNPPGHRHGCTCPQCPHSVSETLGDTA